MMVFLGLFQLAVCPNVHVFSVDFVLTSMCCLHTVTHLVPIPDPGTWQLASKTPLHFSLLNLPGSWAALAAVRHRAACTEASDVLAFALSLSVTAADWQWLPAWQSLNPSSPWPGSQMLSLLQGGMSSFSSLGTWKPSQQSGSSAVAFSIVWMTRYYSSCSDNASSTIGAIKVIYTLSPSVSRTNVELYGSTFDALWLGKWAHACRRISP